jgi:acylphosphatase
MTRRVHLIVRGVVQGVGFRWATEREARRLGVRGYVRNLPTGDVEIVAEGRPDAIDRLVAWTKHGPPGARVETVNLAEEDPTGEFSDFGTRH